MTPAQAEVQSQVLEIPRSNGRPLVVPKEGGKPTALTRVTTFVDALEDKSSLAKWYKRMVMVGAAKEPRLLNRVMELLGDLTGNRDELNALAERLMQISGANDKREDGTRLHLLSEYIDRGEALPADITEQDRADMLAYQMATIDFDVLAVEQSCVNAELSTQGTTDRILWYGGLDPDGEPAGNLIGDLKTGTVDYGALKMAMQLAVYSRSEKYDWRMFPVDTSDKREFAAWKKREVPAEEAAKAYSPLPPVNQNWGVIINLPAGSGECTVYWVDLKIGYESAQLAQRVRVARNLGRRALRPFALAA
ncbi:hypothetical protein [Kineococcus esterisolvens]